MHHALRTTPICFVLLRQKEQQQGRSGGDRVRAGDTANFLFAQDQTSLNDDAVGPSDVSDAWSFR